MHIDDSASGRESDGRCRGGASPAALHLCGEREVEDLLAEN
jgi:hypothetical protein